MQGYCLAAKNTDAAGVAHLTFGSAFSRFHFLTSSVDDVNIVESMRTLSGAMCLKCAFQKGHVKIKGGKSIFCT